MSVFVLKLIAVVTMLLDHIAAAARYSGLVEEGTVYTLCRSVGRIAFLLFAYLLVNGFFHSSDRKRYLFRLSLFALLSQIPFTLIFTQGNYFLWESGSAVAFHWQGALGMAALGLAAYFYFPREQRGRTLALFAALTLCSSLTLRLGGYTLLRPHYNIFYTLAVGFALLLVLESLKAGRWRESLPYAAALVCALLTMSADCDYGYLGLLLLALLYVSAEHRAVQLILAALWCLGRYSGSYLLGSLAAVALLAFYNGRLGRKGRSFFYLFYPVHLLLLFLVFSLITG